MLMRGKNDSIAIAIDQLSVWWCISWLRLQLKHEVLPGIRRFALFFYPRT